MSPTGPTSHQRFPKPKSSPHKPGLLKQRARELRARETPSERALWLALRNRQVLGVHFCRQVPVAGRYIADFVAAEVRVVVEVDGGWHERRRRADARRDEALRRAGYRVLRFTAEEVLHELPSVLERVRSQIGELGR